MAEAKKIYKYTGYNPFVDMQGRNFSDSKIVKEFYPISKFWKLFNNHHEILIGARGSGKTFLLKMMRRSMLKCIEDVEAKRLLDERKYYSLYVPLHMETVAALNDNRISDEKKLTLFKFVFNSLLAESLIGELSSFINEKKNNEDRIRLDLEVASKIATAWYGKETADDIMDLDDLAIEVRRRSCGFDYERGDTGEIPAAFKELFCGSLISVQPILEKFLDFNDESMWIICIDEAEFIPELFQKIINSFMRSDTNRISLKVATLPFYWKTLSTLSEDSLISAVHDFNYQILDLDCESDDFKMLTNRLCSHRLRQIADIEFNVDTLEDFLGRIGNDNRIDYYRKIFEDEDTSEQKILADIINSFPDKRRTSAAEYANPEKTIRQKYGPIFFTRRVYAKKHSPGKGNYIPEWYAGADIFRKVSQGNPRQYLRLMSCIFNEATKKPLNAKVQHRVIVEFCNEFCEASKAIEVEGNRVYDHLKGTGEYIEKKVHGDKLVFVGNSFSYAYKDEQEFQDWKSWIQKAIAFSKIIIREEDVINGITKDTVFHLANAYAVKYWIPMRNADTMRIPTAEETIIKKVIREGGKQMSFLPQDYV